MREAQVKLIFILTILVVGLTFHFGFKFGCSVWDNFYKVGTVVE